MAVILSSWSRGGLLVNILLQTWPRRPASRWLCPSPPGRWSSPGRRPWTRTTARCGSTWSECGRERRPTGGTAQPSLQVTRAPVVLPSFWSCVALSCAPSLNTLPILLFSKWASLKLYVVYRSQLDGVLRDWAEAVQRVQLPGDRGQRCGPVWREWRELLHDHTEGVAQREAHHHLGPQHHQLQHLPGLGAAPPLNTAWRVPRLPGAFNASIA